MVDSGRRGRQAVAASVRGLVGFVGLLRFIEYAGLARICRGRMVFPHSGRAAWACSHRQDVASHGDRVCRGQRRGCGAALAEHESKSLGHAAGVCGLVTGMTGLVFSLGYLFSPNAPLLYGTESIPMALNTALCFLCLGVAA